MTQFRRVMTMVTLSFALAGAVVIAGQRSADVALRAAVETETVRGDVKGAIEQYKRVVDTYGRSDRAIAAQALLRMAEAYQKLGDAQAKSVYERLMRDFADQTETVNEARSRLAGLGESQRHQAGLTARQIWTGPSVDASGTVSRDGKYLSHTDWETGDLTIRDLAAGSSRRLTNTGGWEASGDYVDGSVMSPDGRQVAYNWFVQSDFKNELRVLPTSATETTRPRVILRSDRNDYFVPFGWTADGAQLAVLRSAPDRNRQIGFVSIQSGSFRSVKSLEWRYPNRASLSPDGRYIAYDVPAGEQGSPRDIFVLAADGSSEIAAVRGPSDDTSPVWSANGSRVLFLSNRTGTYGLWAMPIERAKPAGTAVLVKPDVGSAVPLGVTRNGDFYYANPGGARMNVYRANLEGSAATGTPVLATEQFVNSNVGPAWSPDGQSIAFYSFRNGDRIPPTIVIRSVKSGEERTIVASVPVFSPFFAGPRWFPDGRSLMVVARDAQGPGFGFYRLHVDGGKVDPLHHATHYPSSVALSPDGRTIFYAIQEIDGKPYSGRLVRVDIDGGGETVLKRDEWFIAVAVSPDGSQLAYLKSGNGSVIETMPANGGESREVYRAKVWGDGSRYNTLAWTPDQRFLLFVRAGYAPNSPSVLWRIPASGGDPAKVGISMPARIKGPAVRPDGRELLFGVVDNHNGEIWKLENALTAPVNQTGKR